MCGSRRSLRRATCCGLLVVERQMKKTVLMLRSDRGGKFLGRNFTDFVDGKGILHELTCLYTPQQNGMAEREICMGVQHLWWHLALRQAVLVRNCLEGSTTPPGTTPCQLLLGKKPDLTMARVWGCMVQFMVPEQQRGGKLAPKAHWGIHLGVLLERKGWEVFDLTDRKIVTTVEAILYETLSLEVWTVKYGPALGQMEAHPPTDTLMVTLSLLAEVDEPADEAIEEVPPSPPPPVPASPPLVVEPSAPTPPSATGEWSSFMLLVNDFTATAELPKEDKEAVTILLNKKGDKSQLNNY
ncbi:unnamed protein product [Closterium sp. NIES-54]